MNLGHTLDAMRCNDEIELRRDAWEVSRLLKDKNFTPLFGFEEYTYGLDKYGFERFAKTVASAVNTVTVETWFENAPIRPCMKCGSYIVSCQMTRGHFRIICHNCSRCERWMPSTREAVDIWNGEAIEAE